MKTRMTKKNTKEKAKMWNNLRKTTQKMPKMIKTST